MDYWQIKENLMSKSRNLGPVTLSHDAMKEILLKASVLGVLDPLAWNYGISPQLAVTMLVNRLNRGIELSEGDKNFSGLILACLDNMELRKSLAADGLIVPELSGEDFIGLREALRSQKEKSPSVLEKSRAEMAQESGARSRILDAALRLRMSGQLESLDVTKIENRLNKHLPLSEEHKALLKGVADSVELLEKSWNQEKQSIQPLQKTQKDWNEMSGRERARYILDDGEDGRRGKLETLQKGEDTLVCVERKDGSTRDIPLRKIREQLNSLAVSKSREVDLPITQVNHLCNQIAKGNEAAKKRLETDYRYFLQGLFT